MRQLAILLSLLTALSLSALQGCGRTPISMGGDDEPATQEPIDDPDPNPDKPGQDPREDPPEEPEEPEPPTQQPPKPTPKPRPTWAPLPTHTPYPYQPWTPPPVPTPSPAPSGEPTPKPPTWQPQTAEEFYLLIQKFGYTNSFEAAQARIRRYAGNEKPEWSPRAQRDLARKFASARKYLDPAPATVEQFDARAKAFAAAPGAYYVRADISFRRGSDLTVIKGNPSTREVLAFNLKGEMTSFTRLKAMSHRHVIFIPPAVYR